MNEILTQVVTIVGSGLASYVAINIKVAKLETGLENVTKTMDIIFKKVFDI